MHIILLGIYFIQPNDVLNSPHDGKTNIEFDFTHIQFFFLLIISLIVPAASEYKA